MDLQNLKLSTREAVALLTVNRPQKLNAMNYETMVELERVFSHLEADETVRAVIVTGEGEKAFIAGADIQELARETATTGHRTALRGQSIFRRIETLGKPVIAAINGFCLGGGLELALSCHVRVAAEGAKLGLPEVTLGAIPGYGGTQRLARLVGRGLASEMILTGDAVDAAEALRIGLVNRVVPRESLLETAEALARRMVRNAPMALRHALLAIDQGLEADLEKGLLLEATLFGILCGTEDLREGMTAFLEKRKAAFRGK
ncbi:MAG TPA: enoyl-CoA hydratase-related protein [Vicinamibacteria bacterium]|nr:enoyl-CoA hydratase-related protein [Vicinamibacteria bacterium]